MSTLGIEARVGAFVLAALAVLVGFVLVLGDFSFSRGVRLNADFAYTSGLQVGAPVMLSGVRIGRVAELTLLGQSPLPPPAVGRGRFGQRAKPVVRAGLRIDAEALSLFGEDALLHIATQGVIGETYVELTPGTGAALNDGDAIRGVDAPRLHVMALQLSALLSATDALVGGSGGEVDLGAVGDALSSLLNNLDGLLAERRDELSTALADLAQSAADLRILAAHARVAIGDGRALGAMLNDGGTVIRDLRTRLPGLLTEAQGSLASVRALTDKANSAADAADLEKILADTAKATARLEIITADLQTVVHAMARGEGTVGGLIRDPQIYDDVKELLRDLKRNPWKFVWRD